MKEKLFYARTVKKNERAYFFMHIFSIESCKASCKQFEGTFCLQKKKTKKKRGKEGRQARAFLVLFYFSFFFFFSFSQNAHGYINTVHLS